jgi:hypothetical protein
MDSFIRYSSVNTKMALGLECIASGTASNCVTAEWRYLGVPWGGLLIWSGADELGHLSSGIFCHRLSGLRSLLFRKSQ